MRLVASLLKLYQWFDGKVSDVETVFAWLYGANLKGYVG